MYCLLFLIIYDVLPISVNIFMLPIVYLFIISYLNFWILYVDRIDTTDGLVGA